ncbi:hypothetical protein PIB30_102261 [Stylosanthes scabra]|uniref:Uncharacterized protein n=1 Tax=Stylosanthes scabra TaxID=79078 RepID=A0ABU6TZ32_9FABA|nr:hypothetical protein [Stylosanthes scabra]
MGTKGRASSRFGHVTTWSKRELSKRNPSLAPTPSSHVWTTPQHGPNVAHDLHTTHGSRFYHVKTWFKREPTKTPTNLTHAPLNHIFSMPQHDPNLTPIKQETSGARPSQPRAHVFATLQRGPNVSHARGAQAWHLHHQVTFGPRLNMVQT